MSDHSTQPTSLTAFEELREEDEDVSLRKQVAAEIAANPATNEELYQRIENRSRSSIRPRVNELVRMGCVKREGTRETMSGNDAYVHHITDKGRDYLEGEVDPDPLPPLSQVQTKVVQIARQVVYGSTDQETLESAVLKHDALKRRRDPDWSPPELEAAYLADEIPEHVEPKDTTESDEGGDGARSSESAADVTDTDNAVDTADAADANTDGDMDEPTGDTTDAGEHSECAGCGRPVDTSEAESIKFIDGTTAHLCSVCYDEFDQDGM